MQLDVPASPFSTRPVVLLKSTYLSSKSEGGKEERKMKGGRKGGR
jgi:hypothetical protein